MLYDVVEIAQTNTFEKLTPFFYCKFTNRAVRIPCIANQDGFVLTCYHNACPTLTSARHAPVKVSLS